MKVHEVALLERKQILSRLNIALLLLALPSLCPGPFPVAVPLSGGCVCSFGWLGYPGTGVVCSLKDATLQCRPILTRMLSLQ